MTLKEHFVDIAIRATKTFIEAFIPVWATSNFSYNKVALISAGAAGISAVWTFAIKIESGYLARHLSPKSK